MKGWFCRKIWQWPLFGHSLRETFLLRFLTMAPFFPFLLMFLPLFLPRDFGQYYRTWNGLWGGPHFPHYIPWDSYVIAGLLEVLSAFSRLRNEFCSPPHCEGYAFCLFSNGFFLGAFEEPWHFFFLAFSTFSSFVSEICFYSLITIMGGSLMFFFFFLFFFFYRAESVFLPLLNKHSFPRGDSSELRNFMSKEVSAIPIHLCRVYFCTIASPPCSP